MNVPAELRRRWAAHRRARELRRRFPDVTIEAGVHIKGPLDNLELGKGASIQYGSDLHLGGMDWCEMTGHLSIGEGSTVSPHCSLWGAGPGGLRIGKRCSIGPGVRIVASRDDFQNGGHVFLPVVLGDEVTVFANAVIGPGVAVGDGAVIAAGAVVTSEVPSGALVGGLPARVLRQSARAPQSTGRPVARDQDAR